MAMFGRPNPQDDAKAAAYGAWLSQRNPFAIASLVLGVFSLTHLGTLIVDSIAGAVLGVIALRQLRIQSHVPAKPHGRRLAWVGIATSVLSLAIAVVLYAIPRPH